MVYVKWKCGEKAKLCYMDTHSLIVYIKADYVYKVIAEDVETKFDFSNYKLGHRLKEKIKKTLDQWKMN